MMQTGLAFNIGWILIVVAILLVAEIARRERRNRW